MRLSRTILSAMALAALMWVGGAALADDNAEPGPATFYKDVLPILQKNCQECHRPSGLNMAGMIAPMALTTYQEARPWAKSIARVVQERVMPPWLAAPEFHGVFANERSLGEDEIATLVRWATAGAPAGNPADAPPAIVWPSGGWSFGEPDLVIRFDKPFVVADDVQDLYANITVDIPTTEDRFIRALEFRPGSQVVHHIIGHAIGSGESFGRGDRGMIGGIAPGNDPDTYPDGYGILLPAGGKFTFAMHYHKEKGPGTAAEDVSEVGFKFYEPGTKVKPIHIESIGNRFGWEIPPMHPYWEVGSAKIFDRDVILLNMMPHMHLRGRAAKYEAFYPDGRSEVLLWVPNYDFNWQLTYEYPADQLRRIPAGTRLENTMWFENTPERGELAGIDPTRPIRFGGPTTDEMDLGWIAYAYTEETPAEGVASR